MDNEVGIWTTLGANTCVSEPAWEQRSRHLARVTHPSCKSTTCQRPESALTRGDTSDAAQGVTSGEKFTLCDVKLPLPCCHGAYQKAPLQESCRLRISATTPSPMNIGCCHLGLKEAASLSVSRVLADPKSANRRSGSTRLWEARDGITTSQL